MLFKRTNLSLAIASALGLTALGAHGQIVVNDTLTGASSSYAWSPQGGACLTAGDGSGSIPKCKGLAYYGTKTLVGGYNGTMPDAVGYGALRLTNGDTSSGGTDGINQNGAVVSSGSGFSTAAGVQISWTSVTYGGNGYLLDSNNVRHGADGISFFLADAAQPASVGGLGGSLGYSCSNGNSQYNGVLGGYIGVGIDEFGNFVNPGDNTHTGPGSSPGTIGVRGAGVVNATQLQANYSKYYPSAPTAAQVKATCKAGVAINYSSSYQTDANGNRIAPVTSNGTATATTETLPDYGYLTSAALASGSIDSQQRTATPKRSAATPISYQLSITPAGILDFYYSINGGSSIHVINAFDIVAKNGALPASVRFGFAAGTGSGSNVHEITCFKAAPTQQSNTSAGSSQQQAAKVTGGTQIFLAYYYPDGWYSSLQAFGVNQSTAIVNTTPYWDANCLLTGGACAATGVSNTAQDPANGRAILTWSGTAGTAFEYASLTAAQKTALDPSSATTAQSRLDFLRGVRSGESTTGFRVRKGVLGDIVDSSPVWVGAPASPYTATWTDKLYSVTPPEGSSYTTFAGTGTGGQGGRTSMVYVGANDGMLHVFRSGIYNTSTATFTNNDGKEMLAYMPGEVLNMIHSTSNPSVDYSSGSYSHNFYVDGTPGTGDLYYAGAWHTWVVGGLAAGGQPAGPIGNQTATTTSSAIFALDATDPSRYSEANASSLVLGEWTPTTITCTNVTSCGNYLGQTYGTPQIRRLHDGNWAVLFGNGLNSVNGTAGLFVMTVNSTTGAKTFKYFDTGAGASGSVLNGITEVMPVDLDGDHVADYVYAGDVLGNLWRFDLTSSDPTNWKAGAKALFKTATGQPITTRVAVASVAAPSTSGLPKVIVAFGTGQKLPLSLTSAETYATAAQSMYGVWDWDMAAWNATATDTKYDSLTASTTSPLTPSNLQSQTLTTTTPTGSTTQYRTDSNNTVCWQASTACASGNTKYGWSVALPGTNEQVIYNPVIAYGYFIVNTTIPAVSTALTCNTLTASGFTMLVQMLNGGSGTTAFLAGPDSGIYSGVGLGGVGTVAIVTTTTTTVTQTTGGGTSNTTTTGAAGITNTVGNAAQTFNLNPPPNTTATGSGGSRVNWTEVR